MQPYIDKKGTQQIKKEVNS